MRRPEATAGGPWKIMHILGAMSLNGMVATMTIEEPTDTDIFLAYVEHLLCPVLKPGFARPRLEPRKHSIRPSPRLYHISPPAMHRLGSDSLSTVYSKTENALAPDTVPAKPNRPVATIRPCEMRHRQPAHWR